MACGCSDNACNCVVQSGGDIVVSGTGTAADPYIVTFTETEFAGVEGDGIDLTAGGTNGHAPTIAIKIDPASNADVSAGPDGLLINIPTGDDVVPSAAFSPGMEMGFAGPTENIPSGWLPEDGSLKAIATFPNLFAAIGHLYNGGVDPGGGMFRLPDSRGRAHYGPRSGDSIGDMDGTYGSESAHGKTHLHGLPANTGGASAPLTTSNAVNEGVGSSHHDGHLVKGTGVDEFVGDADLNIANGDFAPDGGGAEVSFTKLTHYHEGTADSHAHPLGGNTDATEIPHLIVNKIIKT